MTGYEPTTDDAIEMMIDQMIRGMDELCALAADPKTADLMEAHRIAVGQILSRAQLIVSFLIARKTPSLKVVSHV